MKRPSMLNPAERAAYYRQYVEPLLSEPRDETRAAATAPTGTRAHRGTTFPGTMVIAALLLGCALGWGTSWIYYRHMRLSDEAMLQMHNFIVNQEMERQEAEAQPSEHSAQD